jgi:hypothetical protein
LGGVARTTGEVGRHRVRFSDDVELVDVLPDETNPTTDEDTSDQP